MTYWICAKPNDSDFLASLGVILCEYDEETGCFVGCLMSSETKDALENCCMRYRFGVEADPHIPAVSKIQTIRETFEDAVQRGCDVVGGVDDFFDKPIE